MNGAIPPLLQYDIMSWFLVKAEGQLYLLRVSTYIAIPHKVW